MDTLLLDRTTWDLCLDASGNVAKASAPYSRVQDVASAVRLFLGELWYDTTKGVPYFTEILGQLPPMQLVKERLTQAALTVPGVVSARVVITAYTGRRLSGQVQFIDVDGAANNVSF